MPLQSNDVLLHKLTQHSNVDLPVSPYVGYDKFPEQNKDLLGTEVSIKIRDRSKVDVSIDDISSEDFRESNFDYINNIWTYKFKVIRCDSTEPYRMVCVSKDYSKVIVTDSRKYDEIVSIYPDQIDRYMGMKVDDQYIADTREYAGVVIACDNGEPCNSVIVESLPDTAQIRIVLEDECQSKIDKIMRIDNIESYHKRTDIILLRKTLLEDKDIYGIS